MSIEDELRRQKPMSIEGPFHDERMRLSGMMTEADRAYRRDYLKDMELAPDEPKEVFELERSFKNPIKRIYRMPWDIVQEMIKPVVGPDWAASIRYHAPKCLIGLALVYGTFYYFKYNRNDWTRQGGWRVRTIRPAVRPGDPEWPKPSPRNEPHDYANRGFKERTAFLD